MPRYAQARTNEDGQKYNPVHFKVDMTPDMWIKVICHFHEASHPDAEKRFWPKTKKSVMDFGLEQVILHGMSYFDSPKHKYGVHALERGKEEFYLLFKDFAEGA